MSFYELYETDWPGTETLGDVVIDLADWMIDVHHTLRRTRNTAYAYEGIIHAFKIACDGGDKDRMKKYSSVIERGLFKLTSWQVGGPAQNGFLKKHQTTDKYALGGIMNHRKEPLLRIDVTQHQMHALILAKRYLFKDKHKVDEKNQDITG